MDAKVHDTSIDLSRDELLEGDTTINVINQGSVLHSIELETVSGGGNQRLVYEQRPFEVEKVVVPLRPGRYQLFCPDHRDRGVKATFTVVQKKNRGAPGKARTKKPDGPGDDDE